MKRLASIVDGFEKRPWTTILPPVRAAAIAISIVEAVPPTDSMTTSGSYSRAKASISPSATGSMPIWRAASVWCS
jgi:hypothetical protein